MKIYDVVVIGGGPAGLIAAGRAAELGAEVLLLEKNQTLGVKLLMTGGGRCNFTNQTSPRELAQSLGINGRSLLSGLSRFGSNETIDFFKNRGVKIRVEANGRVFPASNQASEILEVLINYFKANGGQVKTKAPVLEIVQKDRRIIKLILADRTEIRATNFILASGGKTYPFSGSSGEAYAWLKALGHKIIEPQAALSQIIIRENVKELEGLSLTNASLTLYQAEKKISSASGDFIFTSRGLSGPSALNLSRVVARLNNRHLKIKIDFFPDKSREDLNQLVKIKLTQNKKADFKNILSKICHKRLANFLLAAVKINPLKKGDEVTRLNREGLVDFLKGYNLSIAGLGDFTEAMITVGGVDLREVNPKTMASKVISNLYLAGEVLDLDGPTGGYNLQIAWTTGYLAGENAAKI